MSTETAALNTEKALVADVLPENLRSTLAPVAKDYGAGEFWPEPGQPEKKKEEAPAVADSPKVEKIDPVVEVKSLASRWGAKVKAPAADIPKPVENKDVKKVESAAPAPVAVENPEDKIELDKASSPKARDNFKALKDVTKSVREQLAAKERELSELRAKPVTAAVPFDTAEFDRLKAEHKAMSDKLLVIDTANHPVFQSQYVAPRKEKLSQAAELLKAHGKDSNLAALIERPRGEIGKALQELMADVPDFDRAEISALVRDAHKLSQDEKLALASASQVNGAIKQGDAQTHGHAFESTWGKRLGDVSESLEPVDIPANVTPDQRTSLEAYNAAMHPEAIKAEARKIATGAQSYESISDASIKAVMYDRHIQHVMPRIGAEFNALLENNKLLASELERYRSRNPNRDISPTTSDARGAGAKHQTIDEAAEAAWGSR